MVTPKPIIIKQTSSKLSRVGRVGRFGLFKYLLRHWYIFLIIFSLIPNILLAIQISNDTNNPTYIPVSVGMSVINADSNLDDYVFDLKEDKSKVIGMEKPEKGLVQKLKFFWHVFLVVWAILGLLVLITLPFTLIYRLLKGRNTAKPYQNMTQTLVYGFLLILFVNLVKVIVLQANGDPQFSFDNSLDFYGKAKLVIFWLFPLHGVVSLIMYLITLI